MSESLGLFTATSYSIVNDLIAMSFGQWSADFHLIAE
jgi:hypothetical protein